MSDILLIIRTIFEGAWNFITDITIPGTDFTVAQVLVALALFGLGLRILSAMIGVSFPEGRPVSFEMFRIKSQKYKALGSSKAIISQERRGDDR